MQVLFIQGPEKTSTSTLTGILNAHPEIFILFETYLGQPDITKYGNQLLEKYPESRQFFLTETDYGKVVLDFFEFLKTKEPDYSYKYVGSKLNSLDPSMTQKKGDYKILFTKRDLRSWLIKESIIKRYRTDLDIVVPTIEYLRYIIYSAKYKHAYHFWLEDLIDDNEETIENLSDYLDLELRPHTDNWWEKFGNRDEGDPKSAFRLNHVHHSSKIKPERLDTKYKLKNNQFWNEVNPVFDKYFRVTDYTSISEKEMIKDLEVVENLKKYAPLPFSEVYQNVKSIRLGFSKPQEVYFVSETDKDGKKKSVLTKIAERARRVVEVGLNNYHINKGLAYGIFFYDECQLLLDMLMTN